MTFGLGVLLSRTCRFLFSLLSVLSLVAQSAGAQSTAAQKDAEILRQMSGSFESLVTRVSPAVVEVLVTGYGSHEEEDDRGSSSVGRERSLGSGVIVDPDGYIVTNYHVVKGAERIRVILTPAAKEESEAVSLLKSRGRMLPARVVGFSKMIDLAVLKVEASGLPVLPLARYARLRKGQMVLAFGSPEGLENSVAFGLVSAVLRQPDPDNPMVYIQTDAAINPGNSGGPLVDMEGNVVGIDTFIYSQSGGNEGLGFAIPSGIARYAYEQIRQHGRVRRRAIGADLQTLTPDLAHGLGIPTEVGVIVSDVTPGGPAELADLKVEDIITAIDGMPVDNLPLFVLSLYLLNTGNSTKLQIVRGSKKFDLTVPIIEPKDDPSRLSDLADPKGLIPGLGVIGVPVEPQILEYLGGLRIPSGVLVTSTVSNRLAVDSGLTEGDVIHSLNHTRITSVDILRAAFNKLQPGEAAAMQVERNGKLTYLTFEME